MNETVVHNTSASMRNGKDLSLDSPLLNLILAASLLSKITRTKASAIPPLPYKYTEGDGYYANPPWYPHDSQHYYKLQTSSNAQQANFHLQPINQSPIGGIISHQDGGKLEPPATTTSSSDASKPEDGQKSTQVTQELKDFLMDFFKKNNILPVSIEDHSESASNVYKSEDLEMNPDKITQKVRQHVSEVTSEQLVENMSETMVDNMAYDLPQNATDNEVRHMSQKVIENLPVPILENIPPEMLERISTKISEQITEKLSEKFSKDVSNHMLEKLAQLAQDRDNGKDQEQKKNRIAESIPDDIDSTEENKIPEASDGTIPVFSEEKYGKTFEPKLPLNEETRVKFLNNHSDASDGLKIDEDKDGAASTVDLLAAATYKSHKSSKSKEENTDDDEYLFPITGEDEDDDEDEDDAFDDANAEVEQSLPTRVSPKFAYKLKSTTSLPENLRKGSRDKIAQQQLQERINSKRPTPKKRRTTPITLIYDEYDEAAPVQATSLGKRKVQYYNRGTVKKTNQRKPLPDYNIDDEEEPQRVQAQTQAKKNKKGSARRRPTTTTTTPAYEDYYNDPVEGGEDPADPEYYEDLTTTPNPRPSRRSTRRPVERQQATTIATTLTDTEVTEVTTLAQTTLAMTTATPAINVTSGEYPYYGNNNYNNISLTYGPPVNNGYGYGPSNGNDQVSFTYAPPSNSGGGSGFTGLSGSGSGVAPMLDSWYNQYAKTSMYKRIHDLLTPNHYYNQYDVNYHDSV